MSASAEKSVELAGRIGMAVRGSGATVVQGGGRRRSWPAAVAAAWARYGVQLSGPRGTAWGVGLVAFLVAASSLGPTLPVAVVVAVAGVVVWRERVRPVPDATVGVLFQAVARIIGVPVSTRETVIVRGRAVARDRLTDPAQYVRVLPGEVQVVTPPGWEPTPVNVERLRAQVAHHTGRRVVPEVIVGGVRFTTQEALPERFAYTTRLPASTQQLGFGIKAGARPAVWDLKRAPHGLVSGATGSGKTAAMRSVLASALHAGFQVVGCDPKRVELAWLRGQGSPGQTHVASTYADMTAAIAWVRAEMMERFAVMEAGQVMDRQPVLLVVDEATSLLAQSAANKGTVEDDLGEVARLGRRARCHLLAGMQRPDSGKGGLPGELKRNLDYRLAVGPHDTIASNMIFDTDDATRIPAVVGRGMSRTLGVVEDVQVAWLADPSDPETPAADRAAAQACLPPRAPVAVDAPVDALGEADGPDGHPAPPVALDAPQDPAQPVFLTKPAEEWPGPAAGAAGAGIPVQATAGKRRRRPVAGTDRAEGPPCRGWGPTPTGVSGPSLVGV